jgi:predicted methyltransferase
MRILALLLFIVAPSVLADGHHGAHAPLDWDTALAGDHRSDANKARDAHRHPKGTLTFFGLRPDMTVLEVSPGGGWYTEVLAPLVSEQGKLIAGHGSPNGSAYNRRSLGRYLQKLGENNEVYSGVDVRVMQPPTTPIDVAEGSVDLALVFRNVHSWLRAGNADAALADIFRSLKPGGTLGIVQHRGKEGISLEEMKRKAYVPESKVIAMAEAAGFVLESASEINANAKDTKDYPRGVWTLPPSFTEGEKDRAKYAAIGESDRMTLKFTKPQ